MNKMLYYSTTDSFCT